MKASLKTIWMSFDFKTLTYVHTHLSWESSLKSDALSVLWWNMLLKKKRLCAHTVTSWYCPLSNLFKAATGARHGFSCFTQSFLRPQVHAYWSSDALPCSRLHIRLPVFLHLLLPWSVSDCQRHASSFTPSTESVNGIFAVLNCVIFWNNFRGSAQIRSFTERRISSSATPADPPSPSKTGKWVGIKDSAPWPTIPEMDNDSESVKIQS